VLCDVDGSIGGVGNRRDLGLLLLLLLSLMLTLLMLILLLMLPLLSSIVNRDRAPSTSGRARDAEDSCCPA